MKIVTEKKVVPPLSAITFRLPKKLLELLSEIADKNDVSRQKLVTAILTKAVEDKSFTVKIED